MRQETENSSWSPNGKTIKSEVEDTIADKKESDGGDTEDDLNLFLSKIESNIQKYSKIINESHTQSETDDKNMETSENTEKTYKESPRNKRKSKKPLNAVNADQTVNSPRAKRRRAGGGKEEEGDRRDICQYCDEDYRGRPAASTQLWLHIERQHLRVFYTCTMCDYQVGVFILSPNIF